MSDQSPHVRTIVNLLAGVPCREAVTILASAINCIAAQPKQDGEAVPAPTHPNLHLKRRTRAGVASKVTASPEVQKYLEQLDHYLTLKELRAELVQRFGKEKAPSKSSLQRYIKKISESNPTQEVSHGN